GSPQVAELATVVRAVKKFKEPFNLVTDSAYVAGVTVRAENALLKEISNKKIFGLLTKLICLISHREQPFYVMHVRLHTSLPGPIAEGNRRADALAMPVWHVNLPDTFHQAKLSHEKFHQNVPTLVWMFHLTHDQAKAVVVTCPGCQRHQLPSLGSGVNPRGRNSCEVWQTSVTHFPAFGQLKYLHMSVDTSSRAAFASAHASEKAADVEQHLVQAFATLGVPQKTKTDNGPAYMSAQLQRFLQSWGIEHTTRIPHLPTGQVIVERTHSLKGLLEQK
ncbi:hypothetical protein N302_12203, partial [Corvus brachyrhynchos]